MTVPAIMIPKAAMFQSKLEFSCSYLGSGFCFYFSIFLFSTLAGSGLAGGFYSTKSAYLTSSFKA